MLDKMFFKNLVFIEYYNYNNKIYFFKNNILLINKFNF